MAKLATKAWSRKPWRRIGRLNMCEHKMAGRDHAAMDHAGGSCSGNLCGRRSCRLGPTSGRASAQDASPPPVAGAPAPQTPAVSGGRLHGLVKSGNIPLPGVTVTAQNTLTGKRFQTTSDITGAWAMNLPQNGRYVVRTQFAGFAPGDEETVLNAASRDQAVNFDLLLASRAAQQAQREEQDTPASPGAEAIRQLAASGAQSLSLLSALGDDTETQAGSSGEAGAALPSIAGNSDFAGDSVAISGQAGAVSPLAGLDMDRIRDAIETLRAQGPCQAGKMESLAVGTSAAWAAEVLAEEDLAASAGADLAADAATSAASIPASRMAQSSGPAATPR